MRLHPLLNDLLFFLILCCALTGAAQVNVPAWQGTATYTVWLPQASTPVVYNVVLDQQPHANGADALAPCDYFIQWSADTNSGTTTGFSAYYDGHHYRYRDNRLQEYHYQWDSIPFIPTRGPGVQVAVQFADILPAFVAQKIGAMQADTTYAVTQKQRGPNMAIEAKQTIQGMECQEIDYLIGPDGMPIKCTIEANPGTISEQTIEVQWHPTGAAVDPITEERLMAAYPDVFEKYRENNFRIENIVGAPLPTFSCPTASGQRLTHHRGEAFAAPTLIALLDPAIGTTGAVAQALRQAIDQMPYQPVVIWALTTTNAEQAAEAVPAAPGESLLLNARSLARDCGATDLPVVMICNADGTVANVILGYNKTLASDVIQQMALLQ